MKTVLKLLIGLILIGCTTTAVQHTIYQQQIQQKQEKLVDDAKDFLVKANQMLQVNSGTIDLKRVKVLLEKSQSLLSVDVDDGKELKDLNGEELDKAIYKILTEADKEKNDIEDLKEKDKEEIGKLVTNNIKYETVKEEAASRNKKFYTICIVILSLITAAIYFIPSSAVRGILNIFKK
jgi:hypothetical protein